MQTGHSVTEAIISPEKIEYTGIDSPDILILISEDGLKRVHRQIESMPPGARIYADESLTLPGTQAVVKRYPFAEIGRDVSKLSVAIAAFAAVIQDAGLFPIEALATAIRTFQKASIAEINLRALQAADALRQHTP